MKTSLFGCIAILALLTLCALSACSMSSKTEAPPIAAAPTSTQAPTEVPVSWQIVHKLDLDNDTYFAGFHQENYGITVGYGGEVVTTDDGGDTWMEANNDSWCRFGLDIVDENVAWHVGNGGHVGVSVDGGRNWQRVSDLSDSGISKSIRFLDEQTGWAASEKELWATSDGGQTWVDVLLPESGITILTIELLTEVDGFILTHPGILYATHDGGATWNSLDLGVGGDQISILALPSMRFFDAQNGLIVAKINGKGAMTFRTADAGETWERKDMLVDIESMNPTFFLSSDGETLTIKDSSIMVLRNNE